MVAGLGPSDIRSLLKALLCLRRRKGRVEFFSIGSRGKGCEKIVYNYRCVHRMLCVILCAIKTITEAFLLLRK